MYFFILQVHITELVNIPFFDWRGVTKFEIAKLECPV